jgi:hypothetical protein
LHSKRIKELFQLDVPADGKAESTDIFSDLAAQVSPTSSTTRNSTTDDHGDDGSDIDDDGSSSSSAKDDARILKELFDSKGINSALWYV